MLSLIVPLPVVVSTGPAPADPPTVLFPLTEGKFATSYRLPIPARREATGESGAGIGKTAEILKVRLGSRRCGTMRSFTE